MITVSAPEFADKSVATFTEVLPAQKSSKHNAMTFTPGGTFRPSGFVTCHTGRRSTTTYHVIPFNPQWPGRGFHLTKIEGGTDAEAQNYDVFCGRSHASCECKGFLRHGNCKHISVCMALIENCWL